MVVGGSMVMMVVDVDDGVGKTETSVIGGRILAGWMQLTTVSVLITVAEQWK